jgi:predicted amidohydrolase
MKRFLTGILILTLMVSCKNNIQESENSKILRNYKLAMVQMDVKGGDQDHNLKVAAERIKEAAENGARIALLPEALDFGWCHTSANDGAGPIPGGKSFEALSAAAKENDIFVCAGIVERLHDKLFNAAVIIDRSGDLVIKHRKLNELDFAHELYSLGNMLNVADTELGTLGLMICADATAADFTLSKSLGLMGADIILSPSAWAVPSDHDNKKDPYGGTWFTAYKPICKIFDLWFVGVSNVGTIDDGEWTGWNCIGSSIAVDADGNDVIQGPYGISADTIMYIDVKLKERPARGTGWYKRWNRATED